MSAEVVIEFDNGRKLYFEGVGESSGLDESSFGSKVAAASKEQFESALGTLGSLINSLEKSLAGVVKKPKKVEMEFGASLTGDCNLWIVSGEGSASFKVTLTWES
jgi:Trypsin-co-occurring domain 1